MFENVYVSPVWWEQLPDADKKQILSRLGTISEREADYSDDGVRVVDWEVTDIRTSFNNSKYYLPQR